MSKNLIMVIAVILLWFLVIRNIKFTKLPQKAEAKDMDSAAARQKENAYSSSNYNYSYTH